MVRYGFHLSIAGKKGVAGAVEEAQALGLSAFQIFAKSPRSWKTRALSPSEVETFRALREMAGELPGVIHASYLVNLAAEGELGQKSVFSLADDLAKAQALGQVAVEGQVFFNHERTLSARFWVRKTTAEAVMLTASEIRNSTMPMKKSVW